MAVNKLKSNSEMRNRQSWQLAAFEPKSRGSLFELAFFA
jgi:hypothetical protein